MPGRDKSLITRNGIPDPQAYNPQTGQWESFIGVSWGKTAGGLYVPIRVDDQGRQEVTLSGTKVEKATLFPRLVRNSTTSRVIITPPKGVYGMLIAHRVYGVTGSFGSGQGIRMRLWSSLVASSAGSESIFDAGFSPITTPNTKQIWLAMPATIGSDQGGPISQTAEVIAVNFPPGLMHWVCYLEISGSFSEGQGFDSEVSALWLYQ